MRTAIATHDLLPEGLDLGGLSIGDRRVRIYASPRAREARCPVCGPDDRPKRWSGRGRPASPRCRQSPTLRRIAVAGLTQRAGQMATETRTERRRTLVCGTR